MNTPVLGLVGWLAALLSASWLVPNHYPPWVSFHSDWWTAAVGLLLAWACQRGGSTARLAPVWAGAGLLFLVALAVGARQTHFVGDVWMAALYLGALLVAVISAGHRTRDGHDVAVPLADGLATGWVFAAVLSVGIAMCQWLSVGILDFPMAALRPNERPFGNVAQPNHFSTICFLGLCGLGWLRQQRRLHVGVWCLAGTWLILGIVMSQSRTGWLQIAVAAAWLVSVRRRASLRFTVGEAAAGVALLVAGVLLWPAVCDALHLAPSRSNEAQAAAGTRKVHWVMLTDAIGRAPWTGHGWAQVGAAQQQVALDHPHVGEFIEHSHNAVLDLMLWVGVPLGLAIVGAVAWWLVSRALRCAEPRAAWLLTAIAGVLVHGLLEYPLEYAYFLVPLGLAIGCVDSLLGVRRWTVPRRAHQAALAAAFAMLMWVSVEYIEAEENFRSFRLEAARIGTATIGSETPRLRLLNQLQAFLVVAREPATPGMDADRLDRLRRTSERFGYPAVLFRHALASGLNGRSDVARETLERLCRIHKPLRCVEAIESWSELARGRYPQLALVPLPVPPLPAQTGR